MRLFWVIFVAFVLSACRDPSSDLIENRACVECDLRGADLRGQDLSGVNLSKADLRDADLSDARLDGGNLSEANLTGAQLNGASLQRANISYANFTISKASGADFREAIGAASATFIHADLRKANFNDVKLSGHNGIRNRVEGSVLTLQPPHGGADLRGADLSGAMLDKANFSRAELTQARFNNASMVWTILVNATMEGADFTGAKLDNAMWAADRWCKPGSIGECR